MQRTRCSWPTTPLDIAYHDREWGTPVHDDRTFFEFLILEGAQAGLSWSTILNKRENYRKAFAGIVRNRLKIESAISNARAFRLVQKEFGSFDQYIWQFVDFDPIQGRRKGRGDVPASSPQSDAMSKDLKRRGFRFVGTTICYAFMQATGLVNDHQLTCFRHKALR